MSLPHASWSAIEGLLSEQDQSDSIDSILSFFQNEEREIPDYPIKRKEKRKDDDDDENVEDENGEREDEDVESRVCCPFHCQTSDMIDDLEEEDICLWDATKCDDLLEVFHPCRRLAKLWLSVICFCFSFLVLKLFFSPKRRL